METRSYSPLIARIPRDLNQRPDSSRRSTNYFLRKREPKLAKLTSPGASSKTSPVPQEPKPRFQNQQTVQSSQLPRRKLNQPRQRPISNRKNTPQPALANLSNIVKEMKKIFNHVPKQEPKVNKSYQVKRTFMKPIAPRSKKQAISLRNKTLQGNPYAAKKSFEDLINSGKRRSNRRPPKRVDPDFMQKFFVDFHTKSKFLLQELEKNVLGDNVNVQLEFFANLVQFFAV